MVGLSAQDISEQGIAPPPGVPQRPRFRPHAPVLEGQAAVQQARNFDMTAGPHREARVCTTRRIGRTFRRVAGQPGAIALSADRADQPIYQLTCSNAEAALKRRLSTAADRDHFDGALVGRDRGTALSA